MHAAVQHALMEKANHVFADDDTFLSFPKEPLAFTQRELDLLGDEQSESLVEFSMLVNRIPRGPVWPSFAHGYLWEVYAKVLNEAVFASSARTAEEEERYRAAHALVYDSDGGLSVPSRAFTSYLAHRDRYWCEKRAYLAATATLSVERQTRAAASSGSTTRLDIAREAWEGSGRRDEIEGALSVLRKLGPQSPRLTWASFAAQFARGAEVLRYVGGRVAAYPTAFAPSNALAAACWRPFSLSRSEIFAHAARAKRAVAPDAEPSGLAFEFSAVTLVRPWFSPEVFESRFWKFEDDADLLSDGDCATLGLCPAYATGIVFARNLEIAGQRRGRPELAFDVGTLARARAFEKDETVRPPAADRGDSSLPPPSSFQVNSERRRTAAAAGLALGPPRPAPTFASPAASRPSGAVPALARHSFERTPSAHHAERGGASDDTIHVLAFVCKRLPRCPDPDPALAW
jgi:hypothetical protein